MSPAISLTSLLEFEISRYFPHFSAGVWNLPLFPSLLCWSLKSPGIPLTYLHWRLKSPTISLTYLLEYGISHHFTHLSAVVWNIPPFPSLIRWSLKSSTIPLTYLLEFEISPFPSLLCGSMNSPTISLSSLLEFEISAISLSSLLEYGISRHFPHLLCWSLKFSVISIRSPACSLTPHPLAHQPALANLLPSHTKERLPGVDDMMLGLLYLYSFYISTHWGICFQFWIHITGGLLLPLILVIHTCEKCDIFAKIWKF